MGWVTDGWAVRDNQCNSTHPYIKKPLALGGLIEMNSMNRFSYPYKID
jgi:hypothetical protein